QVPDLHGRLSRDTGDQRSHVGKAEIQLRILNRCLCGSDRSFSRFDGSFTLRFLLGVVIELTLRNGAGFREWRISIHVNLRQLELRFGLLHLSLGLGKLPFGLIERGLKWAWINLK